MIVKTLSLFLLLNLVASDNSFNPTILQDTRNLPKVDGTFGFLYQTEDGIQHAAKGDSNGMIHGSFSYTDPTGLKVNYNYNAGSRVTPGYAYKPLPEQDRAPQQFVPRYTDNTVNNQNYYEPEPQPAPLPVPRPAPIIAPRTAARPASSRASAASSAAKPKYRRILRPITPLEEK